MEENSSRKWLYDKFVSKGLNVGKDYAEFDSLITNNEDSRKWAYEKARSMNLNVGKDYAEFDSLIAPKQLGIRSEELGVRSEELGVRNEELGVRNEADRGNESNRSNESNEADRAIVADEPNVANEANRGAGEGENVVISPKVATEKDIEENKEFRKSLEQEYDVDKTDYYNWGKQVADSLIERSSQYPTEARNATQQAIADDVKQAFNEEQGKRDEAVKEILRTPINGGFAPANSGIGYGIQRAGQIAKATDIEPMKNRVVEKIISDKEKVKSAMSPYIEAGYSVEEAVQAASDDLAVGIQRVIFDEYKKQQAPSDVTSYILGSIFRNNLASQLAQGLARISGGASGLNEQLTDEAYGEVGEKSGMGARVAAGVGTLISDASVFGGLGALSGSLAKGATEAGSRFVAKRVIGASGKAGINAGGRYVGSSLTGRMVQGALSSGGTLGSYDALTEMGRQMRTGTGEVSDIAGRFGHGFFMGAALAPIGIGSRYVSRNMSKSGKMMMDAGAFVTEAELFNLPNVIENPWDLGAHAEGFVESAATLGLMKGSHKIPSLVTAEGRRNLRAEINARYNSPDYINKARFTKEELSDLKEQGYDLKELFKSDEPNVANKRAGGGLVQRGVEEVEVETVKRDVSQERNGDVELLDNYAKMMNDPNVPIELKAKMAYRVEGRITANMPRATWVELKQNERGYEVTTHDAIGNPITRKRFTSKREAESLYREMENVCESNSINIIEEIADRRGEERAIIKAMVDMGVTSSVSANSFMTRIKEIRSKKPEERTEEENSLLQGFDIRVSRYQLTEELSDGIRSAVERESGLKIADILQKPANKRSLDEVAALAKYRRELLRVGAIPIGSEELGQRGIRSEELGVTSEADRSNRSNKSNESNRSNEADVTIVADEANEANRGAGERPKAPEVSEVPKVSKAPESVKRGVRSLRGQEASIEDVVNLYANSVGGRDYIMTYAEDYAEVIDTLEREREMAIAWSKGEPAIEKPEHWDYWKEREGFSEPDNELGVRSEELGVAGEGEKGENGDAPSLLDVVSTLYSKGKEVASKLFSMKFFDVARTPKFMQELGLRGDKFTIKYGVIARHLGKDSSHTLTERDWEQLPQALQNPFAISKLIDKNDSYRIYTTLQTEGGEFVVVGADVKNAGREIEINAISTVFGRRNNANLPTNEEVIYRSKEITPEQSSLLERPNFAQYPTEQELSEGKYTTKLPGVKESGEKRSVPSVQEQIETAESYVNTNPTEGQKEAGNYKKGHVQIGKFNITIEQPKGSVRSGVDANGNKWETEMQNTYGYIRGTEGVDGDHIDVFLSNDFDVWDRRKVFVVDQYNDDGSFDEHKVMLGFNEAEEAHQAYLSNYGKDWSRKHKNVVTAVSVEAFENWVEQSHRKTKAFAEYKGLKGAEDIKEPYFKEELLPNGDKRITNYNSSGKIATVSTERNGKIRSVDSYDEGVLFETTTYDENGRSTSVTRYNKQGDVIKAHKFEQGGDEQGGVRSEELGVTSEADSAIKPNGADVAYNELGVRSEEIGVAGKGKGVKRKSIGTRVYLPDGSDITHVVKTKDPVKIKNRIMEAYKDAPSEVQELISDLADLSKVFNVEDAVYAYLADLHSPKGTKLLLNDEGVRKGATSELGLPAKELQKMLGINAFAPRSKGGKSIAELSDRLAESINYSGLEGEVLSQTSEGIYDVDSNDVRSIMIDVLYNSSSPASIAYGRVNNRIDMIKRLYEDYMLEEEKYVAEEDAYNAYVENWLIEAEKAYNELPKNYFENIFADEERLRQEEYEQRNIDAGNQNGSKVLLGERLSERGRTEEGKDGQGLRGTVGEDMSRGANADAQSGETGGVAEREVGTKRQLGQRGVRNEADWANTPNGADRGAGVAAVRERVAEWGGRIGANVRVIERAEDVDNVDARRAIEQGLRVSGWYEVKSGEVCIYAPNVRDVREVDRTIVHEVVSHKGLRGMLGEKAFNKLCDKTWDMMSEGERAKYESYPGVENIEDETKRRRAAADEYISHLAEGVDLSEAERSTWRKVMDSIMDFLKKLYSDIKLTEKDLEEIIKASYRRMRENAENAEKGGKGGNELGVTPIGRGVFGNIYDQFRGKSKEAVQFLLNRKEGEAIGALHHPEVGDIDLVWGKEGTGKSDGFGLAKLAKYHPEVLDNIQEILDDMHVTQRSVNRVQMESDTHQAAVRLTWDNEQKNWLLTAFEKRNSVFDNTTDTAETSKQGKRNDTTTSQSTVSGDKDTTKLSNVNEEGEKNTVSSVQEQVKTDKSEAYMPNVYTYINGISEANSEVIREWEREFRDYIGNLGVANIASIEHTIGETQKKLKRLASDKASADYKAYDFITRRLEHRLSELTKEVKGDRGALIEYSEVAPKGLKWREVVKYKDPGYRWSTVQLQPLGEDLWVRLSGTYKGNPAGQVLYYKIPNYKSLSWNDVMLSAIDEGIATRHFEDAVLNFYVSNRINPYSILRPIERPKGDSARFSVREDIAERNIENVVVDKDVAPKTRQEAITILKTMKQPFFNEDQGLEIYVSNRDARHIMQFRNSDQIAVVGSLPTIIERAVKIGEIPVSEDELKTTKTVSVYYCPIKVGEKQYSGRMIVKEYYEGTQSIDELHLYNVMLKKSALVAQNVSPEGLPIYPTNADVYKVKDLIHNTQEQDKVLLGIKENTRFRVANESQEVFVSNAARAVEQIKQEKATPEQWLKMIEKQGGLKVGEDKWIGLSDWLRASDKKSLTKNELLDFINDNKIKIEEVKYSQYGEGLIDEAAKKLEKEYKEIGWTAMQEKYPELDDFFELYNGEILWSENRASIGEYEDYIIDAGILNVTTTDEAINETREKYTTEGLEHKREIALTVPTIEPWNVHDEVHFGDAGQGRAIAWVRFGETTDGDNNRVLVIDEIQSKRHQEGREKGYIGQARKLELAEVEEKLRTATKVFNEYRDQLKKKYDYENLGGSMLERIKLFKEAMTESERTRFNTLANERADAERLLQATRSGHITMEDVTFREYDGLIEGRYDDFVSRYVAGTPRGAILADLNNQIRERRIVDARKLVPDAPFEKNWSELAMKRMLRLAADEGFDKVAWTTGEQQAERYDIGTKVNHIHVIPSAEERYVSISPTGGRIIETPTEPDSDIIESGEYKGKSLTVVYGKALADKIMSVEVGSDERISGEGLRIGAEGMKGFYDKMLPSFVNKYVKKWGAKVSEVELPNVEESGRKMWSVNVTPDMKRDVKEGQTMFRFIGERGAGALDKVEEADVRLDNLNVARDMENAGKGAKAIKVATGWERGADGKWRYEVSDGKFDRIGELHPERGRLSKEEQTELDNAFDELMNAFEKGALAYDKEITEDTDMADIYVAGGMPRERAKRLMYLEDKEKGLRNREKYLDDYLDDEELYIAYPELREIKVVEGDPMLALTGQLGGYNPKNKTLTLYDFSKDTLLHEVQHAIQRIEGFAKGGSAKNVSEARNLNNQIQRGVESLLNQLGINDWLSRGDIQEVVLRNQKEGRYFNLGYAFLESMHEITGNALRLKLDEANRAIAENNRLIGGHSNLSPKEHYRRLGGEVESRNVSRRMGMSAEERRNSLAEETEDVSRDDQIFIMDSLGVSEMGSRVEGRMKEIGKYFENESLSEEQRAVVDVYSGARNNLTINVKTNGGTRSVVMRQGTENKAGTRHSLFRHYDTGVGTITADDIMLIPEIVAKGAVTEKKRGKTTLNEYKLQKNGVDYTVLTEINNRGSEVFADFYTNKSDKAHSFNTNLIAQEDSITTFDSKDSKNIGDLQGVSSERDKSYRANVANNAGDDVRYSVLGDEVPWGEGESLADAMSRVRKRRNQLAIELSDMDRRREAGRPVDEYSYAEKQAEKERADKDLRYMEIGPDKPELSEGESETDASYIEKMERWRESLLEWKGKKYDEDEYMDTFLRNATGARADMSDEELHKLLESEKEKRNTSIKEMKGLIKEQIRERRRNIEVSNWEDEVTIKNIKDKTTQEERELIPHILEGSYRILPSKDNRYSEYLEELGARNEELGIALEELDELDTRNVESSNYNAKSTANSAGLRNSDIVEYAVDSGNAKFYVTIDGNRALLEMSNGDIYPLNVYDLRYLYWLYDRLPSEDRAGIGLYGMRSEHEQLLGMFLRGEAEMILPKGIRDYKEGKEYDAGLLATVKEIRDWYDEAWEILKREGMTYGKESIDRYVTHIWDLKKSSPHAIETFEKFMIANEPRSIKDIDNYISTNTPYMRTRAIASILDGMEFGLVPKYKDITDIMRDYGHRMNEAVENRRLVEFVKGLRVNGMDAIRETGKHNNGVYVLIDNNALRGYEVHRDVKPVLNIVFGKLHTTDNVGLQYVGHLYDMLGGVLKKLNLSLSFFHHGALTESAVSMMKPWQAGKCIFKNIMWDAAFKGHVPAFNDVDLTRDAVKHFVQLGATQDYAAKDIKDLTARLAQWAEGKPGIEEIATIVDFWNKGMDTFLWEYIHDGFKIYGYGKLASEIRAKAEKEGWSESTLDKALDEAGQLINDTYGGQHWDLLGWSPNTVRWARRALLSPDWTLSTLRQALSPFGIGQLYADDKFWKKWFKNDPVSRTRKKYGRAFWLTAGLVFIPLMNGLNAYFRMKDEEEERKTNPGYKSPYELAYPDGMKWWDYTMLGNTIGHQTHLFVGRYEDGKEMYVRWGKQFRELPELFIGRDGVSFPQPMIDKIVGKLNPTINLATNLSSGYSLTGFQNSYMKNKRGWERELARVHVLISSFLPYSIPTDEEKEFKLSDLIMPSTKGFSKWKAIDKFKVAIASGDVNFVGQVYDACVMNGLDAESLCSAAIKEIEVAAKKEMIEGVADVNDAISQYDSESNPVRRMQLKRYILKQMSAQDYKYISREEFLEEAQAFIESGVIEKNMSDYDSISTSEDLIEDWRLRKAKAGLKPYWDEYRQLREDSPTEALEYYERNMEYIEKYREFNRAQRWISKYKKDLGKGKDEEVMGMIRKERKEALR